LQIDTTGDTIMLAMSKLEKIVEQFLREPPEVSFDDVGVLLSAFGFKDSGGSGSHRVFVKPGDLPIIVPTIKGRRVKKVYVRMIIDRLGLEDWDETRNRAEGT
jgi:predicted RNA binding protein YcfA (HicA-like mRNA interferase family)